MPTESIRPNNLTRLTSLTTFLKLYNVKLYHGLYPWEKFAALDKCRKEVDKINFKQRNSVMNLLRDELAALISLKQRSLYIQEAERQLSDSNFYRRVDHLTMEHHNRVISVVQVAITKGELKKSNQITFI